MDAKGRKKYFNIDENISSAHIYLLLDNIDSDHEEEKDNLTNDSDMELIADKRILPANNTLTIPEANIHVVRDNEVLKKKQIKKRKKSHGNTQRKRNLTNKNQVHLFPKNKLNEIVSPMEIFELVTGFEELINLIIVQTNLYPQQKERNFTVDNNELKSFLRINFIMTINKSPTIEKYWRVDNLIGNNVIQNSICRQYR